MCLVGLVKMYKELVSTAREVGEYFGRSVVVWWHHGNDVMVEWNERKGNSLYNMVEWYYGEFRGKRGRSGFTGTSCEFLLEMQSGVVGRNDCTRTVCPHS